ncbi:MAG: UDP-N-acetylglucosamine 1-carboxyvinyltransferase, partial [Bacteroidota bacterium]|nr:UDP-N-acetylglucosamine 1-carboxyvinyltransferase [Bacteroidota bacterium]
MKSFEVTGGRKLSGEITPQGAKNEALQVICAVLLTGEEVTISNIPEILDVNMLIGMMSDLGVDVKRVSPDTYTFRAADVLTDKIYDPDFLKKAMMLRGSVMLAGPLLARFRRSAIPRPGGDKIGRRRMDTHIIGLQKLGATVDYEQCHGCYRLTAEKITGADILLDEPSVTGTANLL